ncbi:MAG: glycosyltransferase [Planctomycetes bacterium]|nr:glycosyltransferase [Planctomycetota bacterium]
MGTSDCAIHLVSLSAVTWGFGLVGRTRMLTEAWLRQGQPTTFVQVPSYRTALQRLATVFRPPDQGPVVRPWPIWPARWWNPAKEGRLRRAIRRRAVDLRRQLDRLLDLSEATAVVISPVWTPWLDSLPFKHVIYDCIDEVAVHVPRPRLVQLYEKWEDELVQRAAGAVVTAEALGEALRRRRTDLSIATIRNGVDVERFEAGARSSPRPADVPAKGRPIVGFVGALYEWIDWKLIGDVARALPDYDFVFVGPHDGRGLADMLTGVENATFLGARPYDRVPAYVQAFDVCWVPFDQSRVSRAANPVKIYEYLALGKPVVSTPVADTDSFEGLVRVGRDLDEIGEHLRAALAEGDERVAERVHFARANSWEARAADYVSFVASLAG